MSKHQPTKRFERIALPSATPGTERFLAVHRYGQPGARPKAYLQASLHADELPGMLALHHLIRRLDQADAAGMIQGEIVVVPVANPIGLAQLVLGELTGRFHLDSGQNFNRAYPDLFKAISQKAVDQIGADPAANVALVRRLALECLADVPVMTEHDALRVAQMRLAIDADYVLDLHCDVEAVLHMYTTTWLWPLGGEILARDLGCEVVLLAEDSGGAPFDETFSGLWHRVAQQVAERGPLPPPCLSATVELRGKPDVFDALAGRDAQNLYHFLQRRGLITGKAPLLPDLVASPCPLTGLDYVRAPVAGLIAYQVTPGDRVDAGDVIAEIVDPMAEHQDQARTKVKTMASGVVMRTQTIKLVGRGNVIASVAGGQPLSHRTGTLLSD